MKKLIWLLVPVLGLSASIALAHPALWFLVGALLGDSLFHHQSQFEGYKSFYHYDPTENRCWKRKSMNFPEKKFTQLFEEAINSNAGDTSQLLGKWRLVGDSKSELLHSQGLGLNYNKDIIPHLEIQAESRADAGVSFRFLNWTEARRLAIQGPNMVIRGKSPGDLWSALHATIADYDSSSDSQKNKKVKLISVDNDYQPGRSQIGVQCRRAPTPDQLLLICRLELRADPTESKTAEMPEKADQSRYFIFAKGEVTNKFSSPIISGRLSLCDKDPEYQQRESPHNGLLNRFVQARVPRGEELSGTWLMDMAPKNGSEYTVARDGWLDESYLSVFHSLEIRTMNGLPRGRIVSLRKGSWGNAPESIVHQINPGGTSEEGVKLMFSANRWLTSEGKAYLGLLPDSSHFFSNKSPSDTLVRATCRLMTQTRMICALRYESLGQDDESRSTPTDVKLLQREEELFLFKRAGR